MPSRSKRGYDTFLDEFIGLILVVCPSCQQQAVVATSQEVPKGARLTCAHCGFNQTGNSSRTSLATLADPYFGLSLWLSARCGTNQVWAYNYEHLRFLREHVEATLRERNGVAIRNQSVASRLPKWMLAKK